MTEGRQDDIWDINSPSQASEFVDSTDFGTLIAFVDEQGKARTGKLVNRSRPTRKVIAETEYGRQFVVPYESVLWIKTGQRWPRKILNLLKGKGAGNGEREACDYGREAGGTDCGTASGEEG